MIWKLIYSGYTHLKDTIWRRHYDHNCLIIIAWPCMTSERYMVCLICIFLVDRPVEFNQNIFLLGITGENNTGFVRVYGIKLFLSLVDGVFAQSKYSRCGAWGGGGWTITELCHSWSTNIQLFEYSVNCRATVWFIYRQKANVYPALPLIE